MNRILDKLNGGSLISDGRADEAAGDVISNPSFFNSLVEGLSNPNEVIRGRAAHALEKVARIHPDWFDAYFERIRQLTVDDPIPMVRWHLVMLLTDMAKDANYNQIIDTLLTCLNDKSTFVLSWAISGLCILGRRHPDRINEILRDLKPLRNVNGIAVRTRAGKAIDFLSNPALPIPKSWVKTRERAF